MTIRFIVPDNAAIDQAEVERVYAQMLQRSPFFARKIDEINGAGQMVTIKIGWNNDIGGPLPKVVDGHKVYSATTKPLPDPTQNIIFIPLENIRGTVYNSETGPPMTLERVIAHELGHVYNLTFGIPINDPHNPSATNDAVYFANKVMESYGEVYQTVYQTIFRPGFPFDDASIVIYDENGQRDDIGSTAMVNGPHNVWSWLEEVAVEWVNGKEDVSPLVLDLKVMVSI